MKAKTRLLLFQLFAAAASGMGRGAITGSFVSGNYGHGLDRQLARLEAEEFLETLPAGPADRVWRLTAKGRDAVFGGRDPEAWWSRTWDGRWRMVFFDLPRTCGRDRMLLRRAFRARGLGHLQGSVWISPDPVDEWKELKGEVFARSLLFMEGRPCGGETDADIVAGAWDWAAIDARYQSVEALLAELPENDGDDQDGATARWVRCESRLWEDVEGLDPFLPRALCPSGYRGFGVLAKRKRRYAELLQRAT